MNKYPGKNEKFKLFTKIIKNVKVKIIINIFNQIN